MFGVNKIFNKLKLKYSKEGLIKSESKIKLIKTMLFFWIFYSSKNLE